MLDLKIYFDAVNSAAAEVQRIANDIDALFREETEEAKAKALALQPELEKAQAKHDEAISLYETMQKANRPNDIAKNFVPVSPTRSAGFDELNQQPTVIQRQEYDKLSLVDRARFIQSGGTVVD